MRFEMDAKVFAEVTALARLYNSRTPAIAANTAAYRVARRAQTLMPAATMSRIDTQMGATTVPVLSTRGKRKGLPLKSGRREVEHLQMMGGAMRIVLARLNPNSAYNRLTGSYWAIDRARFSPGMGVMKFWEKVNLTAIRMVKARHSSIAFLKAGWKRPIRELAQSGLVSKSALRNLTPPPPRRRKEVEAGYVLPAREGVTARCEIANDIGVSTTGNAVLNAKHNRALIKYGEGPLRQAIAEEGMETIDYIVREEAKRRFGNLRPKGVILDV